MSTNLNDYSYNLPEEKIAQFPVSPRDASKLLRYEKGSISHKKFTDLPSFLGENSLLVFNDTKVIPARLFFKRDTGAVIEVFLLEPTEPSTEIVTVMEAKSTCTWKCLVGNAKRWKIGEKLTLNIGSIKLFAELVDKNERLVKLSWDDKNLTTVDVINAAGKLPIPPYLNRDTEESDKTSYQTVYAQNDGAVAAPTAGLHFTNAVFSALSTKGVQTSEVTLHVGAGTFKPVTEVEDVTKHDMHAEQFIVSKATVTKVLEKLNDVTAVGTTSIRTLESLFWLGNQLFFLQDKNDFIPFVHKLEPYNVSNITSAKNAFTALLNHLTKQKLDCIKGSTSIMIMPGYDFKVVNHLITNFHQPNSTLMLLIAAFIGDDWKKVYNYALQNDFRFLSFGDSSILSR